jgi:hypothetical protein
MRPISYRVGYQGESNINSVEVHPQLINNERPLDGELVGASSLWHSTMGFMRIESTSHGPLFL